MRSPGQGLVEYALILGFVSIVAAGALSMMNLSLKSMYSTVSDLLIRAEAALAEQG